MSDAGGQSVPGRVEVASEALAQLIGQSVLGCPGVVGLTTRERRGRPADWLRRDEPVRVDVDQGSEGLLIDCSIAVEHGLNLARVTAGVRARLREEVERLTGLPVYRVEVHVGQLRRTKG